MMTRSPSGRRAGVLLLFLTALVPLLYVPGVLYPYVVPKAAFFRAVVALALVPLVMRLLAGRAAPLAGALRDPFLWALAVFVAWNAVASLASEAPGRSVFGGLERMGGLGAWGFFLLYYPLLRAFLGRREWRWFLRGLLAVGIGLCLYGLLQGHAAALRLNLPAAGGPRAIATLGNAGYLGGYLLLLLGLAPVVWRQSRGWGWRTAAAGVVVLGSYLLVLTGTRAAWLGAGVGLLAVGIATFIWARPELVRHRRALILGTGAATALAALLVAVGGLPLSEVAERMETALTGISWRSRMIVWSAALGGFVDQAVLGAGLENFVLFFDRNFDPALYNVQPGATLWDRAHNVFLDHLVTSGLPGLLAYGAMWAALLAGVYRGWRRGGLSGVGALGLAFGLVAHLTYLAFWFHDHSGWQLWIAVAAFVASTSTVGSPPEGGASGEDGRGAPDGQGSGGPAAAETGPRGRTRWLRWLLVGGTGVLVGVLVLQQAVRPVLTGRVTVEAMDLGDAGEHRASLEAYEVALARAGGMWGWKVLDRQVDALARAASAHRWGGAGAESAALEERLAGSFRTAGARIEEQIERDPANSRVYLKKNQLYRAAHLWTGEGRLHEIAVESMERAIELAPKRIRYRHLLASTYLEAGRAEAALRTLEEALEIYDRFGETYEYVALAHLAADRPEAAAAAAERAVELGAVLRQAAVVTLYGERLVSAGDEEGAAELYRDYLGRRYSAYGGEGRRVAEYRLRPGDRYVAARLPVLYLRLGDLQNAQAAAERLLIGLVGEQEAVARIGAFLRDLEAGRTERWIDRETVMDVPPPDARPAPENPRTL